MAENEKQDTKTPEPTAGSDTSLAELQAQVTAMQAELAAKGEREAELLAALKGAGDRISSLEGDAMRQRFSELAAGWHGETAKHVDMLEKLAQLDGESGDSFQFYVQTQNALAEQVRQSDLFKERGTDAPGRMGSATEQANKLAALRAKESNMSLGQALQQVFSEQPDLYQQYVREVTQKAGA